MSENDKIDRLLQENKRLQAKVDRLAARGIEGLRSENKELRDEIKSVKRFDRMRAENNYQRMNKLSAEIERLLELLRECQPYVEAGLSADVDTGVNSFQSAYCFGQTNDVDLLDRIEKELGNE